MFRLLAFLGLIFGRVIAKYTKDEIEQSKKYFKILEKTLLFSIILTMLYFVNFNILMIFIFVLGFILGYFFWKPYLYLGLGLVSSYLLTSLVFMYGLVYGTAKRNL